MIRLDVWLTLPDGAPVKAGTLVTADPDAMRGGIEGQFRYDVGYLEQSNAFALDPFHLPLRSETFNAMRPESGVHAVFEDSLPDDWGRRIMVRRHNLSRQEQRVPQLLRLLGSQGLGALAFTEQEQAPAKASSSDTISLQKLMEQASLFEQQPMAAGDHELAELFKAGSSPGGARPKALVNDKETACIAKFASSRDRFDVVGLEAAAMKLACQAGIPTAESRLVHLSGAKCLLVTRFDINKAGGRNHLISMQSLLKADGYYNASYRDLAEVIRHISAQPARDLQHLYMQMVFNMMIGNTDDHLKNFLMLHDETGYRLSPAFDLLPDVGLNRHHVLRVGLTTTVPDGETLLAEANHFGIKRRSRARELVMTIHEAVAAWQSVFTHCQVPKTDSETIGADIEHRLNKAACFS